MIRRLLIVHLFLLMGTGAANSADLGPANGGDLPGADTTRVAVGTKAPDFALLDADSTRHALSDFRGKQVVLVFFRGSW